MWREVQDDRFQRVNSLPRAVSASRRSSEPDTRVDARDRSRQSFRTRERMRTISTTWSATVAPASRTSRRNAITVVAPSQIVVDLMTSPGRGPNEAEALIEWMGEHEDTWRT